MDKKVAINGASEICLKDENGEVKMSVEFVRLSVGKDDWLKAQIGDMYKEILRRLSLSS